MENNNKLRKEVFSILASRLKYEEFEKVKKYIKYLEKEINSYQA